MLSLRRFISSILIVAQVGLSVTPSYALPEVAKGTQAPVESSSHSDSVIPGQPVQVPPLQSSQEPTMTHEEAKQIIAEAERTPVAAILGEKTEPTTPEKKRRFWKFFSKLTKANTRIGFIPNKTKFVQHVDQNQEEVLREGKRFGKHSMQMFMAATVIIAVAATTNAYFDIIPFGYWLDQVVSNPDIRDASAQTVHLVSEYTGELIGALGDGALLAAKFIGGMIGAVVTYSFLNALISALFSRTQSVLVQKLNNVSGITQGRFAIWLLEKMDNFGDRLSRFNSRVYAGYRKLRGQQPADANTSSDDLLKAQELNRALLSHVAKLRSHMQAAGFTTGLTASEIDGFLAEERTLWAEWQNNYLNNFVETQRNGRTNVWESVYYSPQHFSALVRNAVASADINYEHFETTKDRIIRRHLENEAEIDRMADKMKAIIKEVRFNTVRDPEKADKYRLELEQIKLRLAELGANSEQISRLEDLATKWAHSNYEAVTNLVLHLRRDIEFPEFTIELPEPLYQRLLQVRESLGLDYYLRQMREEVIAVGEDYGLKLSAYSQFNEMYHALRRQAEAKQRLARSKRKSGEKSVSPSPVPPGNCDATLKPPKAS